jgi:branched-chain amino acid transport system substrate-binding protein
MKRTRLKFGRGNLRWLSAALVAAAVAIAAGCGEPGKGGGGGGSSGGGSEGPIQVGTLFPTSGTVAAAGTDMLNGWKLWWKLHGNKVAGRTIESTQEDTAGDPNTTLTKARKLVQQNQSSVTVGPLLANEAYALAGYLKENPNVIGLNPAGSSDDLSQRKRVDNFVRAGGWQSSSPAHLAGAWAASQGWKRVITLCTDYAFGYENCGGFTNTFTDHGGKVIKQLYSPIGTSDYSSYLAQIDPKSVDGVFVQSVGADAPKFIKAWADLGLKGKVPLITNETTFEQSTLRGIKNNDPVGLESFGHYVEGRNSPGTRNFVAQYQKAYGQMPSYYSCSTYTAAQWLSTAIQQMHGDISNRDDFLKTLNAVKLKDTCFGPMALDSHGGTIADMYMRKVTRNEDGKLENQVVKTYPNVSQFYIYKPDAFLKQPVYSREYQGTDWPKNCSAFARDCPLPGGPVQ